MRVFLERDGGAHQCELIMINDEALVQTKSLSTQLSLTTNQRNPGCPVIAGNTGNVVCNTSFTNLSDSRVKTEMAEVDVAELQQLFDSVEAKQYKRPDMNEDLRLGFASNDFAGTKWKNLTGTARWSDGTLPINEPTLPMNEPTLPINESVPLLTQTCQERSPLGNLAAFAHFSAQKIAVTKR